MSTGHNYRGFDIAQRVEVLCGAGFQPEQSPLRERLPALLPIRLGLFVTEYHDYASQAYLGNGRWICVTSLPIRMALDTRPDKTALASFWIFGA